MGHVIRCNKRELSIVHGFYSIMYRALDKREYLVIIRDNFCIFCFEPYVVTPHLNCLDETVQMRGHNIWFW